MDLLVMVPKFIYREDFFTSFVGLLKQQTNITRIKVTVTCVKYLLYHLIISLVE